MDRLTYKHDDKWCINGVSGKLVSDKHANYWGEAINRLAEYENAEEQGRLVTLPCKVGDSYFTYSWGCHGSNDDCFKQDDCDECPHLLLEIRECKFKNIVHILNAEEEFGKTIFLTREEIEAAIRGENNND